MISEPWGMLDEEELPRAYGECVTHVLARDPKTLFFYWEVTPEALHRAREVLELDPSSTKLVLRLTTFVRDSDGGVLREQHQHIGVDALIGSRYLAVSEPIRGVRVQIGLVGRGQFIVLAGSPEIVVPQALVARSGTQANLSSHSLLQSRESGK